MSWPFDDGSDLPLRDGLDVGGAQERTMAAMVGGYSGIRTVEELNPDGSITTLRTRGGRPIFETTAVVRRSIQAQKERGFVAKIPARAVLFDPYTLDILDANYQPAVNAYSVQDFATSWNVPAADGTDWYDVVLFDGTTIKVNAKAMPTIGITANHGYPAIPYVINRETAEDQYGNAERNTTEKRVFAVGRHSVTSWGGGGVTETLTPTAPRAEDRAMTIGQRVDHSTDTAWIGQLYHHENGWDYIFGEWSYTSAHVLMTLTSTYLLKTADSSSVAMPIANFGSAAASSGTEVTPILLPATPIAIRGDGEVQTTTPFTSNAVDGGGGHNGFYSAIFPWRGVVSSPLDGQVSGAYSRTTYSGLASLDVEQSGIAISYSSSNSKRWDVRNNTTSVLSGSVDLAPEGEFDNSSSVSMTGNSDNLYWGQFFTSPPTGGLNANPPGAYRGINSAVVAAMSINGSAHTRSYEEQDISASVAIVGGENLISLSAARRSSYGNAASYSPNSSVYDSYLANPYGQIGASSGIGIASRVAISAYVNPSTDAVFIRYYHGTWSPISFEYWQPTEAVDTINAKYLGMQLAFAAQTYFDNEFSSGFYRDPVYSRYYYVSINPSVNLDTSTMSWSSKDYILYDDTNGVYISVEGEFSGVDTSATLTVTLKVQTRHHTVTQTLGEYIYTYTQLVQEREIGITGKYAMPSPQIRAIFAPLFQEQGSFKGAHYVTLDEENNGAAPAHLFNFVLYPEPYGALGTLNATNEEGWAIHFVPCNLLEMLYAFVFSQEYGVAEDGTRYPVTFTARYNDMMNTLFSNAYRVAVRDGVQGNWSDSLGADFASISTVSLHRA